MSAITNPNAVPVYVTQPDLPPLDDFIPYLKSIWDSKILTNGGPHHQALEQALANYLEVSHLSLFNNGTIGLITALQALHISGEVITTPYSFVATANSLLWNNIQPVFVDIDPKTLNIDPRRIEKAITDKTTAIMPVHVYGYPCDVDAIEQIAQKHQLKVIYDAAHAFAVKCHCGTSVLNHGDLSVLSFHATKVFNTFEGGAIVCKDLATKNKIDNLKNFGFVNEVSVIQAGINGKMSEIHAAMGLLQLKYVDQALAAREKIACFYNEKLQAVKGVRVGDVNLLSNSNHSYYPIFIEDGYPLSRDALYEKLKSYGIFTRRYFYPLISEFQMYENFPSSDIACLPNAHLASRQVLCLPIYPKLSLNIADEIVRIISE